MKSIGQKATFLAICAVLATALMTVATTLWSEDLTLSASLTTGEVDASISCSQLSDNDGPSSGWAEADYPAGSAGNNANVTGSASSDGYAFNLNVAKGYPGFAILCKYKLLNNGTVPWHLEVEALRASLPGGSSIDGTCDGTLCSLGSATPTDTKGPPIYARMNDLRGCQLHGGEKKEGSVLIGINQSAEQHVDYNVTIKLRVNQWNESGWLGCGVDDPAHDGPVLASR